MLRRRGGTCRVEEEGGEFQEKCGKEESDASPEKEELNLVSRPGLT